MNKVIPIFLLFIICINHLNILDAVWRFNAKYKVDCLQNGKNLPIEDETSKEAKEKLGEEDKFWHKVTFLSLAQYSASIRKKVITTTAQLKQNPYLETDIQPPKAA